MTMATELPAGVWKSLSELAVIHGVSKVAIKKRVDRFERDGLVTTRREGRERLVDVAAYDKAIGVAGDAYREQSAATARELRLPDIAVQTGDLRDAQTQKTQWEARRAALDVNERLGKVVAISDVETAMVKAGEAIVRALAQLPTCASDLMLVARDGEPAMRRKLREIEDRIRRAAGGALTLRFGEGQAEEEAGGAEFDFGDGE